MAEVNSDGGGGGGKHGKKGRKKHGGNPRVDMTPMVDLAFLLLTFFVLTSNLNKAKTMEFSVPKDAPDTSKLTKIDDDLAHTILLDGNKEGIIYVYAGKFADGPPLNELTLDPKKGIRKYILEKNTKVNGEMKVLRSIYKTGRFSQDNFNTLQKILSEKARPNEFNNEEQNRKREEMYKTTMARMQVDLAAKQLNDTTYRLISSSIKNDDKAPFFIVKWGGDAKYNDVINVVDELKIADVSKSALTKISRPELEALSGKTGRKYPELLLPDPAAAGGK